MASYPNSVEYRWTKRDCDIRDGRDAHLKRPTPYDVPAKQIRDAGTLAPGAKVVIPLAGSWSSWYLVELTPDGYEWRDVPDYAKSAATVGELCAALLAKDPGVYPPLYYDIANKPKLRRDGTAIEQLLFDHWANTEWRYATTLLEGSGGFAWNAISPTLKTKVGDVALRKVLAKKAMVHRPAVTPGTPLGAAIRGRPHAPQIIRADPEYEPRTMEVGYNHPWAFNKYGIYFGPHDEPWIDRWPSFFRRNMRELACLGVRYVRIFLLCAGQNMGRVDQSRTSHPYDAVVTLPGAKDVDAFVVSMQQMLQALVDSKTGIRLIPSFVDFKMFGPRHGNSGVRRALVRDKGLCEAFLSTMLDPLLDASKRYAEHVHAWEIINEPYWTVHSMSKPLHGTSWPTEPPLTIPEMNGFLFAAWDHIGRKGFKATVGHRFYDDLKEMATGDLRQFHYYAKQYGPWGDPLRLPKFSESQAFVGEIDAAYTHGYLWDDLGFRDRDPDRCLFMRLELLESLGYQLAMIWPDLAWEAPDDKARKSLSPEEFYDQVDDPLTLGDRAKRSIKEFTKGKPIRKAK